MFASRYNAQVPDLCVKNSGQQTLKMDALAVDWKGIFAYVCHPQQILSQVLKKFNQTKSCLLILIALYWSTQRWFPELLNLSQNK